MSQVISVDIENKTVTLRHFIHENAYLEMMYSMAMDELKRVFDIIKERHGGEDGDWTISFDKNEDGGVDISFERQYDEVVPATKELLKRARSYAPDHTVRITEVEGEIKSKRDQLDKLAIKLQALEREIDIIQQLGVDTTTIILEETYRQMEAINSNLCSRLGVLNDALYKLKENQKKHEAFIKLMNEVE